MKTWIGSFVLMIISTSTWAQGEALTNATVRNLTSIDDPAVALGEVSEGWLAFSMPVIEGTRSPCCWQGNWTSEREVGCKLNAGHDSYGTRHGSPPVNQVIAYAGVRDGKVESLRLVGEACPVDGGGAEITWIGTTDDTASLDWLDRLARSSNHGAGDSALYATALHASPQATRRLQDIALDRDSDLSEEAVFWLGEARGIDGYRALDQLLDQLPRGDTRQHINFGLSQNDSPEALARLADIAGNDSDPEQRGNALFWLAQEHPDSAESLILEALADETDEDVLEQAVFAASQLPESQGTRLLLGLARDPAQPREIRRQAMFWLANSDDDEALAGLEALLTR